MAPLLVMACRPTTEVDAVMDGRRIQPEYAVFAQFGVEENEDGVLSRTDKPVFVQISTSPTPCEDLQGQETTPSDRLTLTLRRISGGELVDSDSGTYEIAAYTPAAPPERHAYGSILAVDARGCVTASRSATYGTVTLSLNGMEASGRFTLGIDSEERRARGTFAASLCEFEFRPPTGDECL
jgi:hypothetical protein